MSLQESYFSKHMFAICIPIAVIVLGIIFIPMFNEQINRIHGYANDMQRLAEQKDVECWKLQLDIAVAGNGIWSLDPVEKHLHEYAQSKLDKGECVK